MRADRPSATARLIAQSLLLAARDPALAPLLRRGETELLEKQLRAMGGGTFLDAIGARARMKIIEGFALPGITLHYIARKRWIEAKTRAALAAGAWQIVVLGAGLDTLGRRLAGEFAEARVIELDHPTTQASKRRALGETSNFFLRAADFNAALPHEILAETKEFSRDAGTLFIAEGLLMYLDEMRVARLLCGLATLSSDGSRLLFTYLTRGRLDRNFLVRAWLRLRGEPFQWTIAPAAIPEFLRANGWTLGEDADAATLRTRILAPAGLAPAGLAQAPLITGERLVEALPRDGVKTAPAQTTSRPPTPFS